LRSIIGYLHAVTVAAAAAAAAARAQGRGRSDPCLSDTLFIYVALQKGLAAARRSGWAVIAEGQVKRESMTPFFLVPLSAGRDDHDDNDDDEDGVLYGSIQGRNDLPRAIHRPFFSREAALGIGVGARSQGRVFARGEREGEEDGGDDGGGGGGGSCKIFRVKES
jgi:hypothetical protein